MRILLLSSAYNGLTQRAHLELKALGHKISVELALSDKIIREGVKLFKPDLIICPFLKDVIPTDIWRNYLCIIIHPGVKGDRGPSSMDWAIMNQEEKWGVTALKAVEEMDAGDIWSSYTFERRDICKARMYRHEITEGGIQIILDTVKHFDSKTFLPEQLDYSKEDVKGKKRPLMTQSVRAIDWKNDLTDTIINKIYTADNHPGVLDTIYNEEYYMFGAHREWNIRGKNPGEIIAQRHGAICRATVDGAVWISHLRKKKVGEQIHFKLPATMALGKKVKKVPESSIDLLYTGPTDTFSEIWYKEKDEVGYLFFDFYNGAMGTEQCIRLKEAFLEAQKQKTKVIILSCGMDFWSNGIHLNTIEYAKNPADESWKNINAIDDLIHVIITTETHLTIAGMLGNAGAGGVTLAAAFDKTYARAGVVLNPHYKSMGLYGSEYWTYLLPKKVGKKKAIELTDNCLPISTQEALSMGLIDGLIYDSGFNFHRDISRIATEMAHSPDFKKQLAKKKKKRELDEKKKPLAKYRAEELIEMKKNFYDPKHCYPNICDNYHILRSNFVYKVPVEKTPLRIAKHRQK
jgi:putative two-component system hydrogenase maturation factor HypX/HoxX